MTISARASILALVAPLSVSTPAFAAYFVDNAATGCSNGSTNYNPAARNCSGGSDSVYTSWNAANAVPAGSTINVRSGNYYENINITTANTTWRRYPSDSSKPTIDGEYLRPGVAEGTLVAIGNDGVTLDGFVIMRAGPLNLCGIRAVGPVWPSARDGFAIKNCKIHDTGDCAVFLYRATNFVVENNEIYNTQQTYGTQKTCYCSYCGPGGSPGWTDNVAWSGSVVAAETDGPGVVRGNYVHDNHGEGVQTLHGGNNVVFEYNHLYGNSHPSIYVHGSSNVEIRYNLIYGRAGGGTNWQGVAIGNESAGKTTDNIRVYGNLVAHYQEGIAINNVYSGATPTNVYIYNNTVINPMSGGSAIKIQDDKANSSQHIKNNIFWQPGGTVAAVGPDAVNIDWGYNLWGSAPSTVVRSSTDPTHAAGYPTLDIADYFQKTSGWDSVATGALTGQEFALRATAKYAINTGVDLGSPYTSLLDLAGVDFVARDFPRLVNTAPCDLGAGPASVAGRCSKDSDCADGDPCTTDSCDINSHTCGHQRLGGCGDGTLAVFDRGAGDHRPSLVDAGAARDIAGGRVLHSGCSCSYGATPMGSVIIWVLLFGVALHRRV